MIFDEGQKMSQQEYQELKERREGEDNCKYMECMDFTNIPPKSVSMILPDNPGVIGVVNDLIEHKGFFGLFDSWLSNYDAYKTSKLIENNALLKSEKEIYRSLADQHLSAMKSIEEVIETPLAPFKWRFWEFDYPGLTKYLFVLKKGE